LYIGAVSSKRIEKVFDEIAFNHGGEEFVSVV